MPSTTSYEFGDIVLVRFPFTDHRGSKHRPAVVVSGAAYSRARADVILMAVTGRTRPRMGYGELAISDWQGAGLLKPSAIKPVLFTMEQRLVVRVLGRLVEHDQTSLGKVLGNVIG
jgi:mRNA interferase MazF